jgi:hypothetical protein
MVRALASVCMVLVAALAGCTSGAEPLPEGRIDGAVVDQFLVPWGNTTVHLLQGDRLDVTSRLGGFTFPNLEEGLYTLAVAIPGTSGARESVWVPHGGVGRIILQIDRAVEPAPYVHRLGHIGFTDLGLPGRECAPCGWTTSLPERPTDIVLRATWEDGAAEPGERTALTVELRDDDSRIVDSVEGTSPLVLKLHGARLPAATDALEVRVRFHEHNQLPSASFRMESQLHLYYGTTEAAEKGR